MLVLSRRVGEEIVIGNNIRVKVVALQGGRVRLGIVADESIPVHRAEIKLRIDEFRDPTPQPVTLFGDLPTAEVA